VRDIAGTRLTASIAFHTGMAIPLVAGGGVLGVLALARTQGQPYPTDDVAIVEDVAARAAVAILNAHQYGRERDTALTLQHSLLPQRLPRVSGVSLAWRYLPGTAGVHVGGDWYDVLPLEDGVVGLIIGDVMGRGVQAAAVMGQLRATARAHASGHLPPSELLGALGAAVDRLEQAQITTAMFGLLDPEGRTLTIASAGHLPPLLISSEGADYLPLEPGPPLGAGVADFPELKVDLPQGATLLLFTDGLVESRSRSVDEGLAILRDTAAGSADPETVCNRALAALGGQGQLDDDTAMLAVTLNG
jgi:serine phosphatase RsbU (regulator of sigma subunit)